MRVECLAFLSSLLGVASAHFHLQYPPPRGPFVADDEVTFCDGYTNSTTERTEFPLSGGFISFSGSHPHFTFGVILSTLENPASFTNFSQVVDFFSEENASSFCFPVDFSKANIDGVKDGANVTVQMVYDAGDGRLYQCADLILRQNFTISSTVECVNGTTSSGSASTPSPSPTAPAPTTGDATSISALRVAGMIGVIGAVWAVL